MERLKNSNPSRPLISQAQNNTTLWIGHPEYDTRDHIAGQTFMASASGQLDNIQVYSSLVQHPGDVELTLHEFDPFTKSWGPPIAHASLALSHSDGDTWIRFDLPSIHITQGRFYGFRLETRNALIALGEAARGMNEPFSFGHEWSADSVDRKGHYFSYFSLAFKVELCA